MIRDLPRPVRFLLRIALPEDWRDDIRRDLEEAWSERRARSGTGPAALWLVRESVAFSLRFLPARILELVGRVRVSPTDLKLAARSVRRAPLLTVLALVSLTVGIGAAVGGYTLIRGTLFTSLPFPGGDRIVMVQDYDERNRFGVDVGAEEFLRRRARLESFDHFAAYVQRSVVVGSDPDATVVATAYYGTPDFLAMTGVSPLLGRLPDEADIAPGATPVVVIPHATWVSVFGADPGVLGDVLVVGGRPHDVIGVMPEGFGFPWSDDLWIPFDALDADTPVRMIARYREDTTLDAARAEMAAVAIPDPAQVASDAVISHVVTGITRPMTNPAEVWLLGIPIAILVLLLVVMATNVANVVLARNARREPEIAVRSAIGASRGRIVGQLALEIVILAAVAAVLGTVLSLRTIEAIDAVIAFPFWVDFSLDPGAVLFVGALAALSTLIAGVVPALRVTAAPVGDALRRDARGGAGIRFGRTTGALIVVQVTICVGFLTVATLLGQSLLSFGFERYGLPAGETLVAQVWFGSPEADGPEGPSAEAWDTHLLEATRRAGSLREAALAIPGVRMAAWGSRFPGNEAERMPIEVEGSADVVRRTEIAEVGPGYFELLGGRLVSGRGFSEEELAESHPVVVVNEPFVRDRLSGAPALGRRIRVVPEDGDGEVGAWHTVVGVVPDLGLNPGNPANAAAVYLPLAPTTVARLALRGEGEPASWSPRLVDAARALDEAIQVQWMRTLDDQLRQPVFIFRALGIGFLVMGLLALLLSAASVHALTACSVTRRTRELGIRRALGAEAGRVGRDVLGRALLQLALGTVLGSGLAFALLRLSQAFPWEVRAGNPAALALVAGALLLSGILALAPPLRTALRIRPADAMRAE